MTGRRASRSIRLLKPAIPASFVGRLGEALRWPPDSRKFRLLAGILMVLFAAYLVTFLMIRVAGGKAAAYGDFFALWSSGRFLFDHPAAQIYDPAALHAAQVALGMDPHKGYPFPYPPSFLLALWPVALLPYLPAYIVAIGGTLVLYVWATVGTRWRSPMALAALLAPTTTITIVVGQTGFLAAALLAGGLRLAASRPIVSGILLGLLTYKPQLGLLVPVALVAARLWRTIAAACATTAALVVATGIAFGWTIWPAWLAAIVRYAGQFAAQNGAIAHLMPTVSVALAQLGAPPVAADLAQLIAAAAAACLVWRCFRGGPTLLAIAALLVALFLATPHAFIYDLPPVATAVLWTVAERRAAGEALGTGEIVVMLVAMASPARLVAGLPAVPVVVPAFILLLGLIVARSRMLARRAATPALAE
jgi:alpha-1,2-mannosyltransferase